MQGVQALFLMGEISKFIWFGSSLINYGLPIHLPKVDECEFLAWSLVIFSATC